MKSVLISIQPQWVKKILDGEKTVEVRKSAPKLKPPFKCYIYCTLSGSNELFREALKGDVAEWNRGKWADRKGNVVAEFVCDKIFPIRVFNNGTIQDWNWNNLKDSCVPYDDIVMYIGNNCSGYGWHITDLKVYDKPMQLSEFEIECKGGCDIPFLYDPPCRICGKNKLTRPPQSWCYVEEQKG